MPPNPARRTQILEPAIDILSDIGIAGLTHRQVDDRAGLPPGTTSNYFRTRLALLEATTKYVADLHWQYVAALQSLIGQPLSREAVATLVSQMISDPDEQARRRQLARYELFIEGTRRPELRPFLNEISSAAMKSASVILQSAGFDPSVEQVGQLSRLINGLAFSNLTLSADSPGAQHPADLVDRILKAVLG